MKTTYALFAVFLIYSTLLGLSAGDVGLLGKTFASATADSSASNSVSSEGWNRFSTPEECLRPCLDDGEPKTCYYKFNIEYYTTLSGACDLKRSEANLSVVSLFGNQCILGDGKEKTVMVINRKLPAPSIQVCKNDKLVLDVENSADGSEITLHWHGLYQNNYQYYDGVPHLTQCPIISSETFRYQFEVKNSGTHFYHSHVSEQMIDGLYGSLIVRDTPRNDIHYNRYDEDLPEHVILISDYMHELSLEHFPGLYRRNRGQVAQNFLINGKGDWVDPATNRSTNVPLTTFTVERGKRFRFRLINSFSTICLAEIMIQGHSMEVIAEDGANIKPVVTQKILTSTGERVDFILHANQTVGAYWMQLRGLGECRERKIQQHAILIYKGGPKQPATPKPSYGSEVSVGTVFNTIQADKCDKEVVPGRICINQLTAAEDVSKQYLQVRPDYRIILNFGFYTYTVPELFEEGTQKAFFVAPDSTLLRSTVNNISFLQAPEPFLTENYYQKTCGPNELSDCTKPCSCSQIYNIETGSVVELFVIDEFPLKDLDHPFHLHGYEFRVFDIGQQTTNWTMEDKVRVLKQHDRRLRHHAYKNPPGKDTIIVPQGGYTIVRFIANNPGYWLFHCHFAWHTATGMDVVFHVGTPDELPPVPPGFPTCYNWTPEPTFYS